jgi:ADP-heptose:LPS heptosyltransferase
MKAVVTLSIGKSQDIARLTHASLKAYADKIGAKFIVIDSVKLSKTFPHWEKFQLRDLLNKYERIIYLDTDIIVRDDCPDLFKIVPENKIGLFDEGGYTPRLGLIQEMALKLNLQPPTANNYYNTGVMVLSEQHKYLFNKPESEINSFYEQTYLNLMIQHNGFEIHSLDYKFNRMCCMDRLLGVSRLDSYIIHYAGCPSPEIMKGLIAKDLKAWKKPRQYKKRIFISVTGGIGDQVDAQPAVRYMAKTHPNSEIIVETHYPVIFENIKGVKVFEHTKYPMEDDTAYFITQTFPAPDSTTYHTVSNILCHTVDFCSIALLKRTLPLDEKNIILKPKNKFKIDKNSVVLHAGKHWETKTLPIEWWEELVKLLVDDGIKVYLIGKTGNDPSVHRIKNKKAIDLVDKLSLDDLIDVLAQGKVLISNDSAPIHLAGAFDNWIMVLPTIKHPDHILPFRNGSNRYKTEAMYKSLILDDVNTSPTDVRLVTVAEMPHKWDKYLVEPKQVKDKIKLWVQETQE